MPDQAVSVLSEIGKMVGNGGGLLIGVDLHKDCDVLNAAYNDKQGYTEQFNKNLLPRVNHELGADFNLDLFDHHAYFNKELSRIEMHLLCKRHQTVQLDDHIFRFSGGQSILTEYSHKYTASHFQQLAEEAGFQLIKTWMDERQLFSVHYLVVDDATMGFGVQGR